MKVLIIDDEEEICTLLAYQLRKLGIESTQAHTVSDGLQQFSPTEHDLVFLDINLPDGNGLDTIPALKAKNKDIKVVVISAYDSKYEHQKAHEFGVHQFLSKPFTRNMITDIINTLA